MPAPTWVLERNEPRGAPVGFGAIVVPSRHLT
jgi:hypothetical protein